MGIGWCCREAGRAWPVAGFAAATGDLPASRSGWRGRRNPVGDVVFVLVTVALFGLLWLAVRGVERL